MRRKPVDKDNLSGAILLLARSVSWHLPGMTPAYASPVPTSLQKKMDAEMVPIVGFATSALQDKTDIRTLKKKLLFVPKIIKAGLKISSLTWLHSRLAMLS